MNNFHNLPKNWQVKTLAEVCTSKNSNIVLSSIENNTGKYPIYGAKGLLKTIDFYTIENESLGIVKDGAGVGRIFLLPEKSSLIGTMAYIQANKNLNLKYLYHFLHTINFNQYISGSAIPHIYFRDYKKEKIPLPPLEVQKAIVEKLENAFAHIDEAVRHLKSVQTNIPRLKSSLLHSAFSGKLTESQNQSHEVQTLKSVVGEGGETSPFKPPHPLIKTEIPQGWEVKTLGEITNYGKTTQKQPKDLKPDDWILELEDIKKESGVLLNKIVFKDRQSKSNKIIFHKGDVLFGTLRPYLKKVIIADDDGYCSSEIMPFNSGNEITNRYLAYLFLSDFMGNKIAMLTYGTRMPRLGTKNGKELPIPLPPLATQNQIVQILESKFAHLEKLEQFVNASLENLQKLKSSLLNQAFKGELIC
ncbi:MULTISPECIES: restriction endonuclease subunit S [Helicobacter]|uniref:restriction endonuclease subunit S n=1 Tax=Helicobacter TaxID=209 RepID=UPI002FDFEA4E